MCESSIVNFIVIAITFSEKYLEALLLYCPSYAFCVENCIGIA
jgi:hypothetical protein